MLEEKFEIEFTHGLPLKDSPYPGLNPSTYTLKKGAVVKPGRMPLGCDVLVNQDVKVEMRDGINIYIDIFKPTKKGQYPTIMWYAPYGKRDSLLNMDAFNHPTRMDVKEEWEDGLNGFEAPNPSYWVSHGYVVVAPDPRGVGSSEGNAYAWGSKNAEDEYDLIEWISNQDWSNGSVGTTGTSYLAMSQYKVATLNPPSLKAIAPWEGALSPYAESFARGGISDFSFSDSLSKLIYTDTMLEDTKAMCQKYPFFNDYWKDKNSDLSQVEIPAYIVGSWTNAIHSKGATEAFQQIKSKKKWLRIHNTHEWNDYYNPEHVEDLRRFFDFYLKNSDNGWESTPKVRMTVLNPGHEDIVDRVEEHYPQDNQVIEKLYLSEDNHALSLSNSNDNDEKFVVLNTKDDGMTFQILMSESREYIGNFSAKLYIELVNCDDIDLYVYIRKINEHGERLEPLVVTDRYYPGPNGRLRISQRKIDRTKSSELNPVLLQTAREETKKNNIMEVEVPFWPFGMRWEKNELLEVNIATNDQIIRPEFPDLPSNPNVSEGQCIIHFGGIYDSQIRLPLVKD